MDLTSSVSSVQRESVAVDVSETVSGTKGKWMDAGQLNDLSNGRRWTHLELMEILEWGFRPYIARDKKYVDEITKKEKIVREYWVEDKNLSTFLPSERY